MDPLSGGVALAGGALGFLGGKSANDTAKDMARVNRRFVERMSNTAYQRAVADMRAAGLNPMLAYSQGGASTPGGFGANIENQGAAASSSAAAAAQAYNSLKLVRAQVENVQAQTAKTQAETATENLMRQQRLQNIIAQSGMYDSSATAAAARGQLDGQSWRFNETVLEFRRALEKLNVDITTTQAKQALVDLESSGLALPGLRNQAASDRTWWGKWFRPFISDAQAVRGIFGGFRWARSGGGHQSSSSWDKRGGWSEGAGWNNSTQFGW